MKIQRAMMLAAPFLFVLEGYALIHLPAPLQLRS